MSSRCRAERAVLLLLASLLALGACDREHREYKGHPRVESGPSTTRLSPLSPGGTAAIASDPRGPLYERNAYHITQGGRWYRWFNCNGCHAAGGGGMGPALMDDAWRYGGDIDHIYATIMQGRPNGMPAFSGKVTPQQAWQLAAYVRSLSGNVPKDAAPSRREGLAATPPLTRMPAQKPRTAEPTEAPR